MYLRYSNSTLSSKLLLCLLAGVGVGQMGVEVLVQHLARLLAEVPALSPGVQESGAEDHHCLTGRLFQLHLNRVKFLVNDSDHPLDLLGRDGSGSALLTQQVHHVGSELLATL